MSAGGVVILPAAVVLAAGALVVVGAAAAAVLVVRAANAAAEGALRAAGAAGEHLEQVAAEQATAAVAAGVWQEVAADVVELNARIRLLLDRASRLKAAVAIPEPLRLNGHSVTEAARWAVRTEQVLRGVEQVLLTAAAAQEWSTLTANLPRPVLERSGTAAALARYQQTLRERREPVPAPRADTNGRVDAVLRTLDPDAAETDRLAVLHAAALVERDDPHEVDTFLFALRNRVGEVNGRVARRRLAAQWQNGLEESAALTQTELPEPFNGTAARLHAVVSGESDLTPELRTEALEALRQAEDTAQQHFVREMVRDCLAEQGYTVQREFAVEHSLGLQVGRTDWNGEHSADVWVDATGAVHGRVLRDQLAQGDEARLRDRSRCDDFATSLLELATRTSARVELDHDHVPDLRSAQSRTYEQIVEVAHRPAGPRERTR